jgi:hypothetical protein
MEPVIHTTKTNYERKGVTIILPDPLKTGDSTRLERGELLYNPKWRYPGGHKENRAFIDAVVNVVAALPVS